MVYCISAPTSLLPNTDANRSSYLNKMALNFEKTFFSEYFFITRRASGRNQSHSTSSKRTKFRSTLFQRSSFYYLLLCGSYYHSSQKCADSVFYIFSLKPKLFYVPFLFSSMLTYAFLELPWFYTFPPFFQPYLKHSVAHF